MRYRRRQQQRGITRTERYCSINRRRRQRCCRCRVFIQRGSGHIPATEVVIHTAAERILHDNLPHSVDYCPSRSRDHKHTTLSLQTTNTAEIQLQYNSNYLDRLLLRNNINSHQFSLRYTIDSLELHIDMH